MGFWDIVLIAIALSMDACALTVANCTIYKKSLCVKKQWAMPLAFSIFQGIMPLIGYLVGSLVAGFVSAIGGYLVAGIFFVLAVKIIVDILSEKSQPDKPCKTFTYRLIFIQAVATSIDALLIGVTMSVSLTINVVIACLVIALITFLLVAICLVLGKKLGDVLGKYAEWTGAIILLLLAIKNLVTAIM